MKKYIRSNIKQLILAIAFAGFGAIFAVRVQFIKGTLLDYTLSINSEYALRYGFFLGVFIVLELGFYYLYDRCRGRFVVDSTKEVRLDYFRSLLAKDYPSFLKKRQGEYIAQYTNEMEIIENQYFGAIPMLAEIIIKIVIVSIFLFILDYRIAAITLVLLSMPLYVPKLIEGKLQSSQMEFVSQFEKHIRTMTDWLNGFEIIKNFSIEKNIRDKFIESNCITMEKNLRKRQMSYLTKTISAMISYFSHFIILVFAAYLVLNGEFTAGEFFIAVGMIDQLSYPIIAMSHFIQDLVSVKPVNKSILKFIQERPIECGRVEISKEDFQEIEFDNVYFGYENKECILHGLNLKFVRNKQYLLHGVSGSGKTTSMNLLLDYYKPSSGVIKINHIPVNEIKDLNQIITVMRQDAVLFEDTLRNNITMYQNIAEEKIISVLSKVGLDNYAKGEKLDMLIHESGTNLSGGEKRRIVLARSILRETPILILDEPLANLDEKNAESIESYLTSIRDRTLIIISHHFSLENLKKIDKVINFS